MSLSVQSNLFTTASSEIKKSSIVQNDTEDLSKTISGKTNNSSNISGEYTDDENMTGNAKATSKILGLINGAEIQLLEVESDYDNIMSIACKQPINATEFNNAFKEFKTKVENKRSELGLKGPADSSPESQVNIMMAKFKNGTSAQDTLSSLLKLRSSANSRTPEGKLIIAITTPYINGLQMLNNQKAVAVNKNGEKIDRNQELKQAIIGQNTAKINDLLKEVEKSSKQNQSNTETSNKFEMLL